MKEFFRIFFAVLLAGAILIAGSFRIFRQMMRDEAEAKAIAALVESTSAHLDQLESMTSLATTVNSSEKRKVKATLDSIIDAIVKQLEAKPLMYPPEMHKRAYALRLTISEL